MSHSLQNKQDKLTAGTNIDITDDLTINCTLTVEPYAIGAYAFAGYKKGVNSNSTITVSAGTTKAGSDLFFGVQTSSVITTSGTLIVASTSDNGETKTGTWKLMHRIFAKNGGNQSNNYAFVGIWQRIS